MSEDAGSHCVALFRRRRFGTRAAILPTAPNVAAGVVMFSREASVFGAELFDQLCCERFLLKENLPGHEKDARGSFGERHEDNVAGKIGRRDGTHICDGDCFNDGFSVPALTRQLIDAVVLT